MKVQLIFLTICMSTVFFLIVLKTGFMDKPWQRNFRYSNNSKSTDSNTFFSPRLIICPKCGLYDTVWIVTSSANNYLWRAALRQAYPRKLLKSLNITRIFLLGVPKEENVQRYVIKESQEYNDLLQGDFSENYRNLTLKHLMGLRWSSENCTATFLIKSDDDIALNIFEITRLIKGQRIKETSMYGYVLKNMKPMRESSNKWFVTEKDFPGNIYPNYLSGWFYITSLKVAQRLVSASNRLRTFFWIDDVLITGILRQESNIELEVLNNLYATDYRYLECCIRGGQRNLKCEFLAGPDGGKKELHLKFKEFSEHCQRNCIERTKSESVLKTCVAPYEERLNILSSKVEINSI